MKKVASFLLIGAMLLVLLSGCIKKSEKDVVSDLGKRVENLSGYKTEATMTFQHSGKKQTYHADIWFKKPSYYKVVLSDGKKENTQMILRNKDGVFVLTPSLNKSYRFDSDWPNNRSQAYLYHSLAKDILNDPDPSFQAKDNHYIFKTKTNYNTTELANQQITLKKDLTPSGVQVMDKDMNVIVNVAFKKFKLNPNFNKKAFDVKSNMTAARIDNAASASSQPDGFKLNYPTVKFAKTRLSVMKPENTGGKQKYVLKYTGKSPFTLIESKSEVAASSVPVTALGDPANLGFTVGSITGRSLSWSSGGTDYYLASSKLNQDELIEVAQSLNGKVIK